MLMGFILLPIRAASQGCKILNVTLQRVAEGGPFRFWMPKLWGVCILSVDTLV